MNCVPSIIAYTKYLKLLGPLWSWFIGLEVNHLPFLCNLELQEALSVCERVAKLCGKDGFTHLGVGIDHIDTVGRDKLLYQPGYLKTHLGELTGGKNGDRAVLFHLSEVKPGQGSTLQAVG